MLIQKIRADQLVARKNRNEIATALLTALVGEAAMIGKNAGNRESTDDEVIAVIKKFLKNAEETRGHIVARGDSVETTDAEITILKGYLPQQMTADELRTAIVAYKEQNPVANMGGCMGYLKTAFGGRYDGKLASQIAKEVL